MQLKSTLGKLDSKSTILVITPSANTQKTVRSAVKFLSRKRGSKGLYLVLNKPAERVKGDLEKQKINTKDIFFIDTLSASMGGEIGWKGPILYISNPADITEIGIAISNFIAKHKGKKWILVDSLITLKLYTTEDMLAKFAQTLTLKAGGDVQLVMITTKIKGDTLTNKIIPFFDEIVTVE